MIAKKVPVVKFGYPKHWFATGTALWAVGTLVFAYLGITAVEDFSRAFWLVVAAVEGAGLFHMFVLPLFTSHSAGAKELRLRMGLLLRESIPYDWIKDVGQTAIRWGGVRVGIGVRYAGIMQTLFVTSSFQGLVTIELDQEHRLGGLLKRPVRKVVLSVRSPKPLVDLLRERAGLPE